VVRPLKEMKIGATKLTMSKPPGSRVARFVLVHDTKTGKMYQMNT
jgi:hypothetical protein